MKTDRQTDRHTHTHTHTHTHIYIYIVLDKAHTFKHLILDKKFSNEIYIYI